MNIMICGPSGIGKTTKAKHISEQYNLDYISGSMSDLIPETKGIKHSDMLARDSSELVKEDYKLINLRNKLFKDKSYFVTDRSYVDSAAYFIYKQSTKMATCEIEQFISLNRMLLAQQCDLLIFLRMLPEDVDNWVTENNEKRVLNNYYQVQMSSIMQDVLYYMGFKETSKYRSEYPMGLFNKPLSINRPVSQGILGTPHGEVPVLIIQDLDLKNRIRIIERYLDNRWELIRRK